MIIAYFVPYKQVDVTLYPIDLIEHLVKTGVISGVKFEHSYDVAYTVGLTKSSK